jgi:hypothetical protein
MSCSIDPFKAYKSGDQLVEQETLKILEEMASDFNVEISDASDKQLDEISSAPILKTISE